MKTLMLSVAFGDLEVGFYVVMSARCIYRNDT